MYESLDSLKIANMPKEKEPENAEQKERLLRRVDEAEHKRRLNSRDYEVRFLGHCNTTTDIKEANFLGKKSHSDIFNIKSTSSRCNHNFGSCYWGIFLFLPGY